MLYISLHNCVNFPSGPSYNASVAEWLELELELEFYLFDRQLHNIGEIISKNMCEIILSGDSHKGTNWPLA